MNEIHSSNSLLTVVHKQVYMHQELPVFHSIDHSNQNNPVDHHKLVILQYCLYHIAIIDSTNQFINLTHTLLSIALRRDSSSSGLPWRRCR